MHLSTVFSPALVTPSLKRKASEFEEPAPKRPREDTPLLNWLSSLPLPPAGVLAEITRPRSVPAKIEGSWLPPTRESLKDWETSQLADAMGDSASQSTGKTNATNIKPSSSKYRSVLEYNHVKIDSTGLKMSAAIRELVDTSILKARKEPPLSQDILNSTVTSMDEWASSTENVVNNFMSSAMFPIGGSGVAQGGNSLWPKTALPYDPSFGYPISTPKPDYHLGYPIGTKSGFSAQEAHVINHPYAQNYTQPGTGNTLPFLTVELKSEATGGTLFHAENQAAGSGTYAVRSVEWLLSQTQNTVPNTDNTDTVAFSIAATGRLVIISIHWHSPEDQVYYMSYVKGFITTDKEHVQACHNTVKNIVEWGLGRRHCMLKGALQALFPLSQQWQKRTAVAAELDEGGGGGGA